MFSKVFAASLIGIEACTVSVEVDIARGIPQIVVVGLPDAAVSEARERVKAAIKASDYELPVGRIVVNMAPADLRKEGSHFDLAIALGILLSAGQVKANPESCWLIGELSLNGELRPVSGVLPIAASAKEQGIQMLILPAANAAEAALVDGLQVYGVKDLREAVQVYRGDIERRRACVMPTQELSLDEEAGLSGHDLRYVKGQYQAKRALEIAAAGGHNLLMVGEPGSGKSMLAQCLPTIMPPLNKEMALEVTKIYSVAGLLVGEGRSAVSTRPYRAPHHSISGAGLIGGGSNPKPGEISLAHHGVLFLDELAEFDKKTLDNLRQPIESGRVVISRVRSTAEYPCRFLLVAACNPQTGLKRSTKQIISAPLWDRFGLVIWVPPLKPDELTDFDPDQQVSSADVARRVERAWLIQQERFAETPGMCNAHMPPRQLREFCTLTSEAKNLLDYASMELDLTGRTYDHILRTARTIADLDLYAEIDDEHIAEAIQYRSSQHSLVGTR